MLHNFELKNYRHVNGIENEFRRLGIKSYCYGFLTANEVIKYGKGNDNEWQADYWGNRVVRQADAFLGWEMGERYSGCNSKNTFRDQLSNTGLLVDKNFVTLTVFDYTEECANLTHEQADEKLLVIEGKLVNSYIDQHGVRPKCNFAKVKGEHATNIFKDLFDF